MKNKLFFGEYLINRGRLQEEEMLEALEEQRRQTPAFEKMALRLGLLNMKQVFQILTLQAESDLSFADIAVRNGYLGLDQTRFIAHAVEENSPGVGEILVELGKLDPLTLEAELEGFQEVTRKYEDIEQLLSEIEFFKKLDQKALRSLSYIAVKEVYATDSVAVREGEAAESFYCVASGYLRITKENPKGEGEPIYIGNIGPNDVFGESSIFEEAHRTATVSADMESVLLRIDRIPFLKFIRDYPAASQSVLIFIIQRLLNKLNLTNKELAYERQNFIRQDDIEKMLEELTG